MERVLGVRESEPAFASVPAGELEEAEPGEGGAGDELPEPETLLARNVSPALALGNTVHAALEWSARNEWRDPGRERVEGLLAREGLAEPEVLDRALALIEGWIGSAVRGELATRRLRPEAPFTLRAAGTVLRGSIDLLAVGDQGEAPLVVDYKTDLTRGPGLEALGRRYAGQRAVYALAVAEALGVEDVRTAHVFLERPQRADHRDLRSRAPGRRRGRRSRR